MDLKAKVRDRRRAKAKAKAKASRSLRSAAARTRRASLKRPRSAAARTTQKHARAHRARAAWSPGRRGTRARGRRWPCRTSSGRVLMMRPACRSRSCRGAATRRCGAAKNVEETVVEEDEEPTPRAAMDVTPDVAPDQIEAIRATWCEGPLSSEDELLASLSRMTFLKPTPCQAACIPKILRGKDVVCAAQTGSGKH